jgi:membrane glycosyltransferase
MLAHTVFVLEIVTGRAVGWNPQRRLAEGAWSSALDPRTTLATFLGVLTLGLVAWRTPHALLYVSPIAVPWALAIPFAALLGSESVGRALGGLLRAPTRGAATDTAVVRAFHAHRGYFHADAAARFRDLVLDPSLCARLRAALPPGALDEALVTKAIQVGPAGLREAERVALLGSREALEVLHREAWRHWQVEEWELPQGVRAEPPVEPTQARTSVLPEPHRALG